MLTILKIASKRISDRKIKVMMGSEVSQKIHPSNIRKLILDNNEVGNEGARQLSNGPFHYLQILSLSDNRISDEGLRHLSNGPYTHPGNGGSFQMWKKTAEGLKNKATGKFLYQSIFSNKVSTVSINDQFWHFNDITPEFDCMAMNENIGNQDGILVIGKGFVGTCWSIQYWRNPNGGVTVGAQCWTDDRNNSKWSTMDWNAFQECL